MNSIDFERKIHLEWLLTNRYGGFASGSLLGIPTRRYHGLLVAAAQPPLERWLLLAATLERIWVDGVAWEFPAFDFGHVLHPRGHEYQQQFSYSLCGPCPWAEFVYVREGFRLTKRICLPRDAADVILRYRVEGPPGKPYAFHVQPLTAMRDFHSLTRAFAGGFPLQDLRGGITVCGIGGSPRLHIQAVADGGTCEPVFVRGPDWWYGFHYRQEAYRGLDCVEDLFAPGVFTAGGVGRVELTLRAAAEFSGQIPLTSDAAASRECAEFAPARDRTIEERLLDAADAFIVRRRRVEGSFTTTILAGYPWFGDWGRDTFIALPGLLLETRRFEEARQVLETFASAQADGLIPNRFSDYGDGCDYNSVDASLWYIHAADAYVRASGDEQTWWSLLEPVCRRVVEAFTAGTRFNIRVDEDGLLACGDEHTQLTWMDAKHGDIVFTPRHGKPVEVNALWYHALCIMGERWGPRDPDRAADYLRRAEAVRQVYATSFWNPAGDYLYDVIRDDLCDAAIRPNQIFAVSLPHSPLEPWQQSGVLACVEKHLLTPYGLRSLAPGEPGYRPRYRGGPFDRDAAYHQGTVWSWLIGPWVEACLRVQGFSVEARKTMRACLIPLIEHLDQAGLGHVSEIFDGDPPHEPGGCIAQAWSVAELLRAWRMTEF